MLLRLLALAAVLTFLFSCEPATDPGAGEEPIDYTYDPLLRLGKIDSTATRDSLVAWYGAANVQDTTIYVIDGMTQEGTRLFPGTAAEVDVFYGDEQPGGPISYLRVRREDSPWHDAEFGIKVGTTLADLVKYNGQPIEMQGFGWDYGGFITSWNGGKLSNYDLRLDLGEIADTLSEDDFQFFGDTLLSTTDAKLLTLPIRVSEISISPGAQQRLDFAIQPDVRFDRIFPTTSREELTKLYGEQNLRDEPFNIGEGETRPGTLVFPGEMEEFQILWRNDQRTAPEMIRITKPAGGWLHRESGLQIGMTLEEVAAINGRPFTFLGFEWDYGGTVTNWEGGTAAGMLARLTYDTELQLPAALMGDREVSSSDHRARGLGIRIMEMSVPLAGPEMTELAQ